MDTPHTCCGVVYSIRKLFREKRTADPQMSRSSCDRQRPIRAHSRGKFWQTELSDELRTTLKSGTSTQNVVHCAHHHQTDDFDRRQFFHFHERADKLGFCETRFLIFLRQIGLQKNRQSFAERRCCGGEFSSQFQRINRFDAIEVTRDFVGFVCLQMSDEVPLAFRNFRKFGECWEHAVFADHASAGS